MYEVTGSLKGCMGTKGELSMSKTAEEVLVYVDSKMQVSARVSAYPKDSKLLRIVFVLTVAGVGGEVDKDYARKTLPILYDYMGVGYLSMEVSAILLSERVEFGSAIKSASSIVDQLLFELDSILGLQEVKRKTEELKEMVLGVAEDYLWGTSSKERLGVLGSLQGDTTNG